MTECDTCERWRSHGGTCDGDRVRYRQGEGCLGYREDPRGEKKYRNAIAIYIPPDDRIPNKGEETESEYQTDVGYRYLTITRIIRVKRYEKEVGALIMHVDACYWSNVTEAVYNRKLEKALIEQTKSKDKKIVVFNKRGKDKKKW
ncbi:hypothetical protein [Anaerosinus massiliensis]|uniref:hypothetical protein n=1 Tax=Massilibacillus massiliensis TaxID=1806837 RepID=UPI000DA62143|nr:hypothetical protein [Massilibacillus massiliensis]